jgi:hypothetical protein
MQPRAAAAHLAAVLRLTCVVLLALLLAPGISFADRWYRDFEKAVELIGDGECSREAIRLLGAAVVDKPKPNLNARTIAVQTIQYLPYYQLARAHLACGEIDAAREYLEVSIDKGVVPPNLVVELLRKIDSAEAEAGQPDTPQVDTQDLAAMVRETTETIRLTRSISELVNARRGNPRFVTVFQENASRLNQAADDLRRAEEQLSDGTLKRDAAVIENASATAARALEAYTAIQAQITSIERSAPTPAPVVAQPTATPRPTPRPVRAEPTPRPTRPPVVPTRPATRGRPDVPDILRRAASDFLEAEYERVLQSLDPDALRDTRQRAAAHLLRSASRYALYCLGGREDQDRLGRARQDIDQVHALDPSVEPDGRFFSPEFVALFRGTR